MIDMREKEPLKEPSQNKYNDPTNTQNQNPGDYMTVNQGNNYDVQKENYNQPKDNDRAQNHYVKPEH